MTVGTHHAAYEIKLHEDNGVSNYNQVSSRLKVVSRFSQVLTNKFGDLSLQKSELSEVVGSSTGRLPPTLV
jgi:hypothetical protein